MKFLKYYGNNKLLVHNIVPTGIFTLLLYFAVRAIAATENKDCLDLLIQLDGLWFINRWLNDAQNFGADTNDGFIEESITSMLRAVEKLYLESEKSISSGIWVTVNNLLGHHSSKVQDSARTLLNNWNGVGNGDSESHNADIGRMNNVSDKNLKEEG